jgi:acyl-coenzyme A thioesterase PaaI-like protein
VGFFTLETAQAQLSPGGNLGPWIWDLKLRVEQISPEELRIRLPFDDRIARPGGVLIGQAMMAMADTVMVLAICGRMGRFATLATIQTGYDQPLLHTMYVDKALSGVKAV